VFQCRKRPGGFGAVKLKEVIEGALGDAFRELGPAILPPAAALFFIIGLTDFVEPTFQTGSQNHEKIILRLM
jgi:hypothetical protein